EMTPDIPKTLHRDAFSSEIATQPSGFDEFGVAKELAQGILYPSSGGFGAPMNTTLRHRFASDAGHALEFVGMQHAIGVGYPGHLALAGAHVRCRHIHRWPNKIFAHQFCGIAAGDAFEFLDLIGTRIQSDGALGAAKRDVDNGALESH